MGKKARAKHASSRLMREVNDVLREAYLGALQDHLKEMEAREKASRAFWNSLLAKGAAHGG